MTRSISLTLHKITVFCNKRFTAPVKRTNWPPHHGAQLRLNCQCIFFIFILQLVLKVFISLHNCCHECFTVVWIFFLLFFSLQWIISNSSVDQLLGSSLQIALVEQQAYNTIYAFSSILFRFLYFSGPLKSTRSVWNGDFLLFCHVGSDRVHVVPGPWLEIGGTHNISWFFLRASLQSLGLGMQYFSPFQYAHGFLLRAWLPCGVCLVETYCCTLSQHRLLSRLWSSQSLFFSATSSPIFSTRGRPISFHTDAIAGYKNQMDRQFRPLSFRVISLRWRWLAMAWG